MITHSNGMVLLVLLIALWWLYRQYRCIGMAHALGMIACALSFSADMAKLRQIRAVRIETPRDCATKGIAFAQTLISAFNTSSYIKDEMFKSIAGWRGVLARRIL